MRVVTHCYVSNENAAFWNPTRVTPFPFSQLINKEPDMRTTMIVGFAAALMLAGCGTNTGDRAASGALLGAAGGAAIGAAAGNPALGAAAGAVGGAVIGAATDPCDLNLGDPVWRDHGGRSAYERRCGHPYRD
jgi:osmotically inducible lipoprotein OsmB